MLILEFDEFPFGVCDNCGYEFNSEELNEYEYAYCPHCGTYLETDNMPALEEANLQKLKQLRGAAP